MRLRALSQQDPIQPKYTKEVEQMPDSRTYHITRNCLKSGRMFLSLSAKGLFPRAEQVEVEDTASGEALTLTLLDARTVSGLGPFYERHGLEPNDVVVISRDGERYTLTATPKPRLTDYTRPEVQRRLVDRVVEQAPLSEREIRALFPDLPEKFELTPVLGQDGRLHKYEGRWQFASTDADAETEPDRATVKPYRAASVDEAFTPASPSSKADAGDVPLHTRAREALTSFGFRLEPRSSVQLLAHADLGRRPYSVLVQLLAEGTRLDWTKLLARRRELKVTHLAVFGPHEDLVRLQSAATQARATLWSWQSLARAVDLVTAVPVSPVDLEPYFARDGQFEEGARRFERMIERRVDSRGDFSAVLQRLAALRAPTVFLLEDVMVDTDLTRDQVMTTLNLLSEAPFHLVSRVDNGEFCLRQGVFENLTQLSHYALSLTERLPARRTEHVRGNAAVIGLSVVAEEKV